MQRLMISSGVNETSTSGSSVQGEKKAISITPRAGFKPVGTVAGGGWKTVRAPVKKSVAELRWGNNGEDDYDPAYPTPA